MQTTPLRCEIYPLTWIAGRAVHLGRAGVEGNARAWWEAPRPGADPTRVVREALASRFDRAPLVVHSTSWRFDPVDGALVLTYLALLPSDEALPEGFEARPIPDQSEPMSVLEHGLRHFALLRVSDPEVEAALPREWHVFLVDRHPLPAGLLHQYGQLAEVTEGLVLHASHHVP